MTYKLFIDDERFPVDDSWVVVRSSAEATQTVLHKGIPSFISFDHDLGGEDTSMTFINWLVDYMLDCELHLPQDFDWYVHSQNPAGARNIQGTMTGVKQHFS